MLVMDVLDLVQMTVCYVCRMLDAVPSVSVSAKKDGVIAIVVFTRANVHHSVKTDVLDLRPRNVFRVSSMLISSTESVPARKAGLVDAVRCTQVSAMQLV